MILPKHVAGIAADDAAWQEYHVLPNLAHMTAVKQVEPSVQGDITVDIKLTDKEYNMKLISPAGTTAVIGVPKSSISPRMIQVNGSIV